MSMLFAMAARAQIPSYQKRTGSSSSAASSVDLRDLWHRSRPALLHALDVARPGLNADEKPSFCYHPRESELGQGV
ncbi:hypothetical protein KSP40_PGU017812 [Platanthera guangdongensis]|uniref:Uncharacterized protein n=1 Tax=Platanthera guangdongensis TaxID=2320717 RepID=A0ABR2M6K5_9ASPA